MLPRPVGLRDGRSRENPVSARRAFRQGFVDALPSRSGIEAPHRKMARELRSDAQSAWPGIIVHFRATLAEEDIDGPNLRL